MTGVPTSNELARVLTSGFGEILQVIKAMGNEKRLQVLAELLKGAQSFQSLLEATNLQKTALSNHLATLLDSDLVRKPQHGQYELTRDGHYFLHAIVTTFEKSTIQKRKRLKQLEGRQLSTEFLDAFFGH